MQKKISVIIFVFLLLAVTISRTYAEKATPEEMNLVCKNWLSYMVFQKGIWASDSHPQIVQVKEIIESDTLLARCYTISPRGFVVVPILKELPPIKAYSDEYSLDSDEGDGFSQLLREVLLGTVRLYAKVYGSLDASQPQKGDVLLGREHRMEWNKFLKNEEKFGADLTGEKLQTLAEAGPLLTTSWHQSAPYNNLCPAGDLSCDTCPSGRLPSSPTFAGCVAIASAQILKYWNWPSCGEGASGYTWNGDQTCGGTTSSEFLQADFSDGYDWQHMPDSCDNGCPPEDSAALAELCYEVGVAFEMDYGVCASGAYVSNAATIYSGYFGYGPSIQFEYRNEHTPTSWFSLIQTEINNSRPMQYQVYGHSFVCDGWRVVDNQMQYHMNYGWGGSFTTWFALDNLYCYWMPNNHCPEDEDNLIRNIKPREHIPFGPTQTYVTGSNPNSIFCADLDADSDLDLTVANSNGSSVSVLKNNGDGTFQPRIDYSTGGGPVSVFCADLDADGDLDLAVANSASGTVSILKNNGDGTFQPKVDYVAGPGPYSVFCADLDGDDYLDVAVVNNSYNGTVSILRNNGDGSFRLDSSYVVGHNPRSVFCADLDGDFDLDLAVANYGSHNISILKNQGNGTFLDAVNYEAGGYPSSVFCTDLNGDSKLDLAVSSGGSYPFVYVLMNNGNGTFGYSVYYVTGEGTVSVFGADLDGDLDIDLVSGSNYSDQHVKILKNSGNGTFPSISGYCLNANSIFSTDVDGDHDMDLAMAYSNTNTVSVMKNLTQADANQPPRSFPLIAPANFDLVCSPVLIDWTAPYDPNFGDQIRYDLYVSTTPGFNPDSTIVYDSLFISRYTYTFNVGSVCYWKVKAYDQRGAFSWSNQTRCFYLSIRGDANGDKKIDVGDVIYLVNYLYKNGSSPIPLVSGDVTCEGIVDVGDVVFLINYLFKGGLAPSC